MACNHCFRGFDAKVKHSYTCARCKANIVARPRYDYNTVTVIPIDYDHIVELIGHYIFSGKNYLSTFVMIVGR